jgi:hypothetical protein
MNKPNHTTKLHLESLEDRITPTVWNIPWTDGAHVTVSFAPDGTNVDGTASQLFQKMALNGLSRSVWQGEILRALQTWTAVTNIDFSLVSDNGAALGASGAGQGDGRFGDIRIASRPLSSDVLALTTPPGALEGTRGGDIDFNSNDVFTVGGGLLGTNHLPLADGVVHQDLYTVALHEIGHALGLPDLYGSTSAIQGSIMYGYYGGTRGLNSTDIANIQALYGVPTPDPLPQAGNTSQGAAWRIQAPSNAPANASLSVAGALNTGTDVNFYKYTTGASNPNGLTIALQTSDQSLLAGRIAITNALGQVLASNSATGPGQDLTLTLKTVSANATYFIEVDRASGTAFGQGDYLLKVISNPAAPTVAALGSETPVSDGGTNETFDTAGLLQTTGGYQANTHYGASALLGSSTDVDFYAFRSATPAAGQPNVMTLLLRSLGNGPMPVVTVYDANRQVVAVQIIANSNGDTLIQLANAQPGATYYVAVTASAGTPPNSSYRLAVSFTSQVAAPVVAAQGTLSPQQSVSTSLLSVSQSDLKNFTLSATGSNPAQWVTMTITDLLGHVIGTLTARAGETVGMTILLNAGSYLISFRSGTDDGSALQPIDYELDSLSISQPVGSTLSNPNNSSTGSGNTTGNPKAPPPATTGNSTSPSSATTGSSTTSGPSYPSSSSG